MIALFDSGVGGLSLFLAVRRRLPRVDMVYLADTKNFPYGEKSTENIRDFSLAAAAALSSYRPAAMVVACNTASTVALPTLRRAYPNIPIIGVVPAVKPAASTTRTGLIATLATTATLDSQAYQELKKKFAADVAIIDQACPGWVEMVEGGYVSGPVVEKAVADVIRPLIKKGADTFVLGCTHYPWLRPVLASVAGPAAAIVDSGPAVAEQVERVVAASQATEDGQERYLCSGSAENFAAVAATLMGRPVEVRSVA